MDPQTMSLSQLDPKLISAIDAYSSNWNKQHASALIWEEIDRLKNRIRDFEQQILSCGRLILFWKSQQNRLLDVSKLPEDVFLHIWSYIAQYTDEGVESLRNWLAITQVCSHWRKLALCTPTLWRRPCVLIPDVSRRFIDRAGTVPIFLTMDFDKVTRKDSGTISRAYGFASELLCRAESLTIDPYDSDTVTRPGHLPGRQAFFRSLKHPGTLLRLKAMRLEFKDPRDLDPTHYWEVGINRLVLSAQGLSTLNLVNRRMDLTETQNPILNITKLDIGIENMVLFDTHRMRPYEALIMVKLLPNIQYLRLSNALSPLTAVDGQRSIHDSPFSLTSLKIMHLISGVDELQFFLSRLNYPSTTNVTLDVQGGSQAHYSSPAPSPLVRAYHTLLKTAGYGIGNLISVLDSGYAKGKYSLMFSTRSQDRSNESEGIRVQVYLPPYLHLHLHHLLDIHSFKQLETLRYHLNYGEMEMWKAFGCLPNLKFIEGVDFSMHPTLLKLLSTLRVGDDFGECILEGYLSAQSSSTPNLYFPAITSLGRCYSTYTFTRGEIIFVMRIRATMGGLWEWLYSR